MWSLKFTALQTAFGPNSVVLTGASPTCRRRHFCQDFVGMVCTALKHVKPIKRCRARGAAAIAPFALLPGRASCETARG